MRGLAKIFVQSEKGINTWKKLKRKLTEEFRSNVNCAQIHKMLINKKKGRNESVQEYMLAMREIGSRGDIEADVIMQYIIDGIQDESANKVMLYGAKNFNEFKEKLKLYEKIKESEKVKTETDNKKFKEKSGKTWTKYSSTPVERKNEHADVCYNCGKKCHKANRCPDKEKE